MQQNRKHHVIGLSPPGWNRNSMQHEQERSRATILAPGKVVPEQLQTPFLGLKAHCWRGPSRNVIKSYNSYNRNLMIFLTHMSELPV